MSVPPGSLSGSGRRGWWPFLAVAGVQLVLTFWQIGLPGVYMDAVNPDYLVVRILNPSHERIVAWTMDGNLVFNRLPILVQLYHGALTFWFGLPFYLALGTSVEALRLVHAIFGVAVLAALHALLLRAGLRPWQAALACVALALDPVFTFAFRTQSYITLVNDAALLVSVTLLLSALQGLPGQDTRRRYFRSGFFAGLAAFGYFIFFFYLPALLAVVAWKSVTSRDASPIRPWLVGVALGASGYLIGYALMFRAAGGPGEFIAYVSGIGTKLGVLESALTLQERFAYGWRMVEWIVANTWHHSLMFGEQTAVPASGLKTALLVGLPMALWVASEAVGVATPGQRLFIALPVVFFACALVFGSRLGGHHFVTFVPLLYAALALGLRSLAGARSLAGVPVAATMLVVGFGVLAAINLSGQFATRARLAETGGNGLFSDAINRFAHDLASSARKPHLFAPDWGVALPVAFLTRGSVAVTAEPDAKLARRSLCKGRDVAVAIINGDRRERAREWEGALGQPPAATTPYRQRDGATVFDVLTFAAPAAGAACDEPLRGREGSRPAAR